MGTPDLYTQVISAEWPLTSELEEIITDGITDGELPPACRAGSGDTTGRGRGTLSRGPAAGAGAGHCARLSSTSERGTATGAQPLLSGPANPAWVPACSMGT
jgi:hypothetical protein